MFKHVGKGPKVNIIQLLLGPQQYATESYVKVSHTVLTVCNIQICAFK